MLVLAFTDPASATAVCRWAAAAGRVTSEVRPCHDSEHTCFMLLRVEAFPMYLRADAVQPLCASLAIRMVT